MTYTYPTTVRGGFPVVAHYTVQPAEPDVGIFSAFVEDVWLKTERGSDADFLIARMSDREIETLKEDCLTYHFDRCNGGYDY